jgi:mannose-6-phosphate isomerase-like protein (cupin superfamily)
MIAIDVRGLACRIACLRRSRHERGGALEKVNLTESFARFTETFSPRIVGELNGQHVKLVKADGDFIWHHHDAEDELFLVVRGRLSIHLRDCVVELEPGELFIVPRGVEHKPVAHGETHLLLFEPAGTRNTGNVVSARTAAARPLEPESR